MASIFPGVQPVLTAAENELPMCREVKWDFIGDHPVIKNGKPVMVEGAEAVKTWIYNALLTVRYRHIIFPSVRRTPRTPKKPRRSDMSGNV